MVCPVVPVVAEAAVLAQGLLGGASKYCTPYLAGIGNALTLPGRLPVPFRAAECRRCRQSAGQREVSPVLQYALDNYLWLLSPTFSSFIRSNQLFVCTLHQLVHSG